MTEKEARLYWDKIKARTMAIKMVDDIETDAERKKRIRNLETDYIRWFEYYFPNYAKK